MKKIDQTIFIIDDDMSVCNGLRCLFQSVHFNVETYQSAHAFLDEFNHNKRGCIVIDVRMPVMSGLELLENLNAQKNRLPIIMVTGFGDIQMAVRAMKLGAVDFILKPFNDQSLLESIQKYTSQAGNISSMDDRCEIESIRARIQLLSEREKQVVNLISEGRLNKEIAYMLSISISTVEAHRANIMRKMQAKNLAQLLKFYLKVQLENERSHSAALQLA